MSLLKFQDGYVILTLSAEQCADLAEVCYFASEESLAAEIDIWRTFAMMFHGYTEPGNYHSALWPYLQAEQGLLVFRFSARQCAYLSKAATFAYQAGPPEKAKYWSLVAILFMACTEATSMSNHLPSADLEAVKAELRLLDCFQVEAKPRYQNGQGEKLVVM